MSMDTNRKLVEAGYTILRRAEYPSISIKKCAICGPQEVIGWKILEKEFPSKAARERRIKELLKDPKIIMELGEETTPFTERAVRFVLHIQEHIPEDHLVICKTCGKTIDEIWEEKP